ncbi:MAG: hypothetical protein M1834_003395 [Cirrosporium novae-zelandiae]|nr:MAG: hypothetical protein M1834_003395 [Cirrosporium novae-zelandiae]
MVLFKTIFAASLYVLGANAASAVLDLIPENFDKVVLSSGKPALVEFFAPWCGHCKKLAPIYEELAQNFAFAEDKVSIAKVDADANKDLGRRFGVQGFPTLKWFDGKSDTPEEYNGGRDLDSLMEFITDKTAIKPKAKKGLPSDVEMLSDQTFEEKIGGESHVLVAFTAPWCGHCKNLAPIWESLAHDFAAEPNVIIAKVDAEAPNSKATALKYEVKSYPTIKYFKKGTKKDEPYEGGRSENDFVNFINEKANTHRTVGGGLNEEGGRVDILDAVISKLPASSLEDVTELAKQEAFGLEAKYASYYLKVLDKLAKSGEYVQKELKRLEGILKKQKAGLAPEKIDDLMSRSNILRQFASQEQDKGKDEL